MWVLNNNDVFTRCDVAVLTDDLKRAFLAKSDCFEILESHEGWSLDGHAARVVYNDLVGNVMRHGTPPVHIMLRCAGGEVALKVSDAGPGFDLRPPRKPEALSEGGRGLYLVSTHAKAVEADKGKDGGMTVTAILRQSAPL